jgi:hypothetical protein
VLTKIFRKDSSRLLLGQPTRGSLSPLDPARPLIMLAPKNTNSGPKNSEPDKVLPPILNKAISAEADNLDFFSENDDLSPRM